MIADIVSNAQETAHTAVFQRLGHPRTGKPLRTQPAIPHPRRTQRIQPQHHRLLKHKRTTAPETTKPRGLTHTPTQGQPLPPQLPNPRATKAFRACTGLEVSWAHLLVNALVSIAERLATQ